MSPFNVNSDNYDSIVERIFIFLEDGEWEKADFYCEQALNYQPKSGILYLAKLMSELKVKSKEELKNCAEPFDDLGSYKKVSKYDPVLAKELEEVNNTIHYRYEENRNNKLYEDALSLMSGNDSSKYEDAIKIFESIIEWKNSRELIEKCHQKIVSIRVEEEKLEAERKEYDQKIKKITIIGVSIAAILIAFFIVLSMVIIPKQKLNKALALLDAGNYDEAYYQLAKLGKNETINSSKYDRAVKLAESGEYKAAYTLFEQCSGYKDADKRLLNLAPYYYKDKFSGIKTGDFIKFGNYYQKSSTEKEEIEWRVLEVKDGKALIISEKALDCEFYSSLDPVTWEICSLRKWLNVTFLDSAFNSKEQTIIVETENIEDETDKVFLLNSSEVIKYFSLVEDRVCKPTAYALDNRAEADNLNGYCWWWLRSNIYNNSTAIVDCRGWITEKHGFERGSVRPALWIEIN